MRGFRARIIDFIYRGATGKERNRIILTPLWGMAFLFFLLFLIFVSFYMDPYAYSRNPMMSGLFMIMAGIGILSGSASLTFIATPFFVLISILEFKYIEEPELEKRFGKEYSEYKKKTPIIIPKIHRK
ncbi:MAG: isoprenylcysteine carboxylmethyltransferase family protein [Syntrophales bacterium]|nr:isoprenylcysteine carboxylmethyltransferase family protein [Syntrophales bacterium]MDD5234232.1 isoprenylcysteine carboxylmethyltransferase family protein [Syntrophales bacterium]MDD5532215.1 isoprenylcysteine carboxylmethyltransferase family protein [Syntrophales bacterium]